MAAGPLELPDTTVALPRRPFEFSAAAQAEAAAITAQPPAALFGRLLRDQESEVVMLAARRVIGAFLADERTAAPGPAEISADEISADEIGADEIGADEISARVARARAGLAEVIRSLPLAEPDIRTAILAQRAPLGLLGGCWLDVVSQPATQPSVIVNRLFGQHFTLRGAGHPQRSQHEQRRRQLEEAGVYLPDIGSTDFLTQASARPLTALHGCFYLALARLPANFLPELVGVHYVFGALGVDDLLTGVTPMLAEPELRAVLAAYLELAGPAERARLAAGIELALRLEHEHVTMLAELAGWHQGLTLEAKVAAVIARHAPFAGRHHTGVRVGPRPLAGTFSDPGLDLARFLSEFRESRQLQPAPDGVSAFIRALKLGGPMFGIFSDREAALFAEWAESAATGHRPEIVITPDTSGHAAAAAWSAAIAASAPADVVIAEPGPLTDRELFYRLVNIENYPNTRPVAAQRAAELFSAAEIMFSCGAAGRYTDASYFDYTPEALYERSERVYWDKLVAPYRPLTQLPSRDEVIFLQTTYALGALIDAAWIHRIGNLGRFQRPSDSALFAIYADEVGYGDLLKNHITLICRALHSMGIRLPHIRTAAFMDQDDLPDELYGFSLHQLAMALFPDTYYQEILGYNLAIEMFGLGELRLHEIQKLRHYGFDDGYEQAHLTIDNISAGHSRQAADIIVAYLDEVRRTLGDAAVPLQWRRVWRGYASLAYFVEHTLVKQVSAADAPAELLI